jgi:Zn-dependent protease
MLQQENIQVLKMYKEFKIPDFVRIRKPHEMYREKIQNIVLAFLVYVLTNLLTCEINCLFNFFFKKSPFMLEN